MTSSIDGLRPMTAFDRIWPYDGVAFIDLLDDLALDGAEARHAVTPAAVRLTRSFRRFAYESGEPASDLRELLRVASSVPLESSWSRRLVCSLLDAASSDTGVFSSRPGTNRHHQK